MYDFQRFSLYDVLLCSAREFFMMSPFGYLQSHAQRIGLIFVVAIALALSAVPTAAIAVPVGSDGNCHVHVIQRGEILSQIARYYSVTVSALADHNGIRDPNRIYPGQHLCIPPGGTGHKPFPSHPPVGCVQYHWVERGDTLSEIAKSYHVNLHALARLNNISNPNLIRVGQKICIPSAYQGVSSDGHSHDSYGRDGYRHNGHGRDGCGSCGYYHKPNRGGND
jgi:LysM repeat protein